VDAPVALADGVVRDEVLAALASFAED